MIRPVAAGDVHAITALQVRAWRTAYVDFVDDTHMPTIDDRVGLWNGVRPGEAWLLEQDGVLAGVVGVADGEIRILYVDPGFHGRGIGARLLEHAEQQMRAEGQTLALLWTIRENVASRAFYERHGWSLDGAEQELWPGVAEVRYRRRL